MYMRYHPLDNNWRRSIDSQVTMEHECPRCNAPKEFYCQTPKGKKVWPPHRERRELAHILNK